MTKLPLFLVLLPLFGCSHTEVFSVPCPDRPTLLPLPEDLQLQMPEDAILITAENQLKLKAYARKLEVRSGCENR